MRKYQPIWEQLKLHKTVSLSAEPELHVRIITAVRKEKCKDLGWKLEAANCKRVYKLQETIEGKLITFTLVDCTPDFKLL